MKYIVIILLIIIAILIFLSIKYCKKRIFNALLPITIVFICWASIFIVDRHQTLNLKEPIFIKKVDMETKYNLTTYKGIGYRVEVVTKDNQIISATMYMFGKVVAGATT